MRISILLRGTLIFSLNILIHLSCSEEPPSSSGEDPSNTDFTLATKVNIGAQGGSISTEEFSLTVPAGSFSQSNEIKLYSKEDTTLFGEDAATKMFKLEGLPSDFTTTIRVALKYNRPLTDESYIAVSEDIADQFTGESSTVYDLKETSDSAGFLIGYIEPPPDNSSLFYLGKSTSVKGEVDKILQGLDKHKTTETINFRFKYPISYEPFIPELSSILEKNYELLIDSLGLYFGKDSYPDSLWTVEITEFGEDKKGYIWYEGWWTAGSFYVNSERISNISILKSELEIESGLSLLYIASDEQVDYEYWDSGNSWFFHTLRVWSLELFSTSKNLLYPDDYYPYFSLRQGDWNYIYPVFSGIKYGAFTGYGSLDFTSHGFGMEELLKYLFDYNKLQKYQVGEIYRAIQEGKDPLATLIEKINGLKADWWPDFFKHYVGGGIYNISSSVFTNNIYGEWSINNDDDTIRVYDSDEELRYADLSAKSFIINLNHSTIDESKKLQITIEGDGGSAGLSTLVFSNNNSTLEYLGQTNTGLIEISDLKGFYDSGIRHFFLVAVNSLGIPPYEDHSDIKLTLKVGGKPDNGGGNELDYTHCWVIVTVGAETYEVTDFGTGNTYESYTCCQDFGDVTYEGSFSGNTFTGNYSNTIESGTITRTWEGTITIDIDGALEFANVSFTLNFTHYDSNNSQETKIDEKFIAANIPLNGSLGTTGTYAVEGDQTYNHILSLEVYHKSGLANDPNTGSEENLKSFDCDVGGERITIFFSKE